MIDLQNICNEEPYLEFKRFYDLAKDQNQNSIQAICISSFNNKTNQPNSRFVNLKLVKNNEWIFFSNYNSPKAEEFRMNKKISAIFFWDSINTQIRLKGEIFKTSKSFSDEYFSKRKEEKNILAIVSNQSKKIESYEDLKQKYRDYKYSQSETRPNYWGGFSFIPSYFEFWEGHKNRLNKRKVYEYKKGSWNCYLLEP